MAVNERYKNELLHIIQTFLPHCKIWLFGSRALGLQRPGSDIDIALDNGQKIPWEIVSRMLVAIDETTIPMKVDLVDLQSVSADFKKQVLKEGILWKE